MGPTPTQRNIHQCTSYREVDGRMHQVKAKGDQETRPGIFYVKLYAQRRRSIPDHGLGDAVKPDGIVPQHVLSQANEGPREQTRNGTAPRHGKKDRYQQRQIEIHRKPGEAQRNKRLHKQGNEGDPQSYRNAEPVNLNLFPRCVCNGHANVGRCRWMRAGSWAELGQLAVCLR